MDKWHELAEASIAGNALSRKQAADVLDCPDDEILALMDAAFVVRRRFFGKKVFIHVLKNAKSDACPEDCKFCSQSTHYDTPAEAYPMQTVDELVAGAQSAQAAGAWKYCIVTATRGPSQRDLDVVCEAVERIKRESNLTICASLGLLTAEKAKRLKAAGVDRFNHNLETSKRHFPQVVDTHTYADRTRTVQIAKEAGMEVCSGGIVGMGESKDDLIDLACSLRELGVDSVPVNFLDPRPGTPLSHVDRLSPNACLKVLAMFRFMLPRAELRAAGGREVTLRSMQPLALYAVSSIFTSGYLTTGGATASADHEMILDMGFTIERADPDASPLAWRSKDGANKQGLHENR